VTGKATVQVDQRHELVHKAVLDGLVAFNAASAGDGKRASVSVSVTDGDRIVGGAVGRHWHGWVYVDLFWISESFRGQDIGTRVMDALEAHALTLGAMGVHLTTYSWQARPFYEKRGYTVFGELSPYPEGHACYWLSKRF
jgi:GNAT superfamily N-acetyltransferase